MKNFFTILSLIVVCLAGATLWSCSDDDKDEPVLTTELPQNATAFLNKYYAGIKVANVEKETDKGVVTFDVLLINGHKVEFSSIGEWLDVDAPTGQTIPAGIVPEAIDNYLDTNYTGVGVNEISVENYGYEVELVNGIDLQFNASGDFIGTDNF